jgi:hypothetical protein
MWVAVAFALACAQDAPVPPRPLFDGKTLEGWRGFKMDGVPSAWKVVDGAIAFSPEGERGDLVTVEEFDDFEFSFEWKISKEGNSGVMFRVSEDRETTYATGPEYQVLDDAVLGERGDPRTSAGANYALHAPSRDATKPPGSWNEARIAARGGHVEHWLNGEKIVEYELWTEEWKALVAASKFSSMPGYGLNRKGRIALQDHGDPVWYRNLKIR